VRERRRHRADRGADLRLANLCYVLDERSCSSGPRSHRSSWKTSRG